MLCIFLLLVIVRGFGCWLDGECIFVFKQKTAYEMRISDWSSDVCSSDLAAEVGALLEAADEKVEQSVEVFGFTREIKNAFSPEERIQMMEMLWEVAYADGALHDLEASLLSRLPGLLTVSDRDGGLARTRVQSGSAPGRERAGQSVQLSEVAVN